MGQCANPMSLLDLIDDSTALPFIALSQEDYSEMTLQIFAPDLELLERTLWKEEELFFLNKIESTEHVSRWKHHHHHC